VLSILEMTQKDQLECVKIFSYFVYMKIRMYEKLLLSVKI